jgi:hypothetical protein
MARAPTEAAGAWARSDLEGVYLDPMIARPEGGPSSDMQRYEG